MKRIFICVLSLILLCSCSVTDNTSKTTANTTEKESITPQNLNTEFKTKAVWITYYELSEITKKCSDEASFKNEIQNTFKNIKDFGLNTVVVQVRPCADAFYKSTYFPLSEYCFGTQGGEMLYDPLSVMIECAHNIDLKIEAWINPYRVSIGTDINLLSDLSPAKIWYKNEQTKTFVYISDNGIYFNPACNEVIELIVNGVKEIVGLYAIDAIHFDDYFYPAKSKEIDNSQYEYYRSTGGNLSLTKWRISKVSEMIKNVYIAIKEIKNDVKFVISPSGNVENNLSSLYADVISWCGGSGYCDVICPQMYYGFKNENMPFMFNCKKWISLNKACSLCIGLPVYKCGKKDKYASTKNKDAINEFKTNSNIISRQLKYINQLDEINGFYLFSYSSLFSPSNENMKREAELIKEFLHSSLKNNSQN